MKRFQKLFCGIIASLLVFSSSICVAPVFGEVQDYRQKIVFGHGVESIDSENLDEEFTQEYFRESQPSVVIELANSFSETEAYENNMAQRDFVSESQIDSFILNTRNMVNQFYQDALSEAIEQIGCSADIFAPEAGSGFVPLKQEVLEGDHAVEIVKQLAQSPLVERVYVENHGEELTAEAEIQPRGWFGSWDGETLPTINGTATKNGYYKGSGVKVGVSEAKNGIANASYFTQNYPNLDLYTHSSGTVKDHANKVAAIVAAIAPSCTLYSYPSSYESSLLSQGVNII